MNLFLFLNLAHKMFSYDVYYVFTKKSSDTLVLGQTNLVKV